MEALDSRGQKDRKLPAPGAPCPGGVLWALWKKIPPCSVPSRLEILN